MFFAFAAARCLRIFPALAVALAYCVLIGALTTTLPVRDFLANPDTFRFYWHNLTLQTEFTLPGVFHTNPAADAVNGSIWSLYFEVRAYLVVLVLGVFGLLRRPTLGMLAWLAAAGVMFVYKDAWGIKVDQDWPVINAYFCFIGGAFVALQPALLKWCGPAALVSAILLPPCLGTAASNVAMDALLVSATLWFAYLRLPAISRFGRFGDFSYGMFIYAFPTQQLIAWCGLTFSPYAMLAVAFPATLLLAILSWHCIERPCRDLKLYFRGRPPMEAGNQAQTASTA